jgi:hypothetical protein
MRLTVAAEQSVYSAIKSSKGEEKLKGFQQIPARQAAWKPSKKGRSGRVQNPRKMAGRGLNSHEV